MDGVENSFIIPELYLDIIKQTIDETHLIFHRGHLTIIRYGIKIHNPGKYQIAGLEIKYPQN